jgi:hypothetical protein
MDTNILEEPAASIFKVEKIFGLCENFFTPLSFDGRRRKNVSDFPWIITTSEQSEPSV